MTVAATVRPIITGSSAPPLDLNRGTISGSQEITPHGWWLEDGPASLTSIFGNVALTVQGDEPTWHDGYASFPAAGENALITDVEDTPELKVTLGMVFRYAGGGGGPVTLWHSRDGNDGTSVFFSGGETLQLNVGGVDTIVSGLSFPRPLWNAAVISTDFTTDTDNLRLYGKGRPMETYSVPDHRVRAGRRIGIGRQFGTSAGAWDCAYAFIYREQFADEAALVAMMARIETEAAKRGITIANAEAVA